VLKNSTIDFNALFNSLGNSTCSSPDVVLAFLLYEGSSIHNASDQFDSCVYFFFVYFAFHPSPQTKIGSVRADFEQLYLHTHIENCTRVYMNLFTRNVPYYHLLKYLLLKYSIYIVLRYICQCFALSTEINITRVQVIFTVFFAQKPTIGPGPPHSRSF
jgi:hypothetical protein